MYDAQDRRFVAVDWIKGSVSNPQTLVPYVYVNNNPLKYVDPWGMETLLIGPYSGLGSLIGDPVYYSRNGSAYYDINSVMSSITTVNYWNNSNTLTYNITTTDGINYGLLKLTVNLANASEGKKISTDDIQIFNQVTGKTVNLKIDILYKNGRAYITLDSFLNLVSVNGYFKRVSCDKYGNMFLDARNDIHYNIAQLAAGYNIQNPPQWTNGKFIAWYAKDPNTAYGDAYVHNFKLSWIRAYKSVIKDAAAIYDIPPLLLAGVAYVEVAGDLMWVDRPLYAGRDMFVLDKPALETSFGYLSMQVIVAAERLGYDFKRLGIHQINETIASLMDPVQQIFISAMHLSYLRDVDFRGVSATEMTDAQIFITAERYNRGAAISKDTIFNDPNGYGKRILINKADILEALL
jgi:hypothetical protein